jgi:hypothetical protein
MGLDSILSTIRKSLTPRKNVDFAEHGLHIELEPLTSKDEIKILEACKDLDGSQYIEGLKRHSLACGIKLIELKEIDENGVEKKEVIDLSTELIEYVMETGEVKIKSRFLYMIDYLGQWPSFMIDTLFDAFTNMQRETEQRINKSVKFEKFVLSDKPPVEEAKGGLHPIVEGPESGDEGLTEVDKMSQIVDQEIAEADAQIARSEMT